MATIRAFMFHDVRDFADTNFPNRYKLRSFLTKKQFTHQVGLIKSKYNIIRSTDIHNIDLDEDKNDYAVLTFDDGLSDHFYVYHYLKSIRAKATFLVPTAPVSEQKMIHSHKIQFIIASANEEILVQEILENFTNKKEIWNWYSTTKWKNNWWSKEMVFLTNFLREHNTPSFDNHAYADYLFEKYVGESPREFSRGFYLNESQLEEISNNGDMTIGGHGYTSDNLLLIDDVSSDIKKSYNFVKKYSNDFVFSYPNGGFDESIKGVLRECGCSLSYTVNPMTVTNLDSINYLEFPRYDAPQKIEVI